MRKVILLLIFFLFTGLTFYFIINAPIIWQSEREDAHNMFPALLCLFIALASIAAYASQRRSNKPGNGGLS